MPRHLLVALAVIAVLALAGIGTYWWTTLRFIETTDDAYVASDTTIIGPKIDGYVRAVPVRDNQQVKAGDVLVIIDDRDFAAKLGEAEAALAAERAQLETLGSQIALQHALIAEAGANMANAEAEQGRAATDLTRYRDLIASKVASTQRYEQAAADAKKAAAVLAAMRAAATAAQGQLGVLQAQLRQQQAKIAEAEAARDLARSDFDSTVIRSPADGVIGNKGVEPGQYVRAGAQLLAVVPLPSVYVTANFKETQLVRMMPGQVAKLSIDAFPGPEIEGHIESLSPASGSQWSILPPENATGNFTKIVQRVPVRIAVPAQNPLAGRLRPGLSVVVSVDTRQHPPEGGAAVIWGAASAATRLTQGGR